MIAPVELARKADVKLFWGAFVFNTVFKVWNTIQIIPERFLDKQARFDVQVYSHAPIDWCDKRLLWFENLELCDILKGN